MITEFTCMTTCQYKSRIYTPGQTVKVGAVIDCPACEGKKRTNGNDCPKCKGTGRSDPPHHFRVSSVVRAEEEQKAVQAESEVEELRNKLKEMKVPFDGRWKAERLRAEVLNAEKLNVPKE